MDFSEELRQLGGKVNSVKDQIKTEEATKISLVMPFIQLLGYDIFDPSEVVPEFVADVGIKKGEKVDYAIKINGEPAILVEVKCFGDPLVAHDSQLFRYFTVTKARFAVLTNGVVYRFYSDLQEPNKLDETPFLEFDIQNMKEPLVAEVKKFQKERFDAKALVSDAANLKYVGQVKSIMDREIKDPSPEFCRFFLKEVQPQKSVTQAVLDRFQPLIRKALSLYVTELLNDKFKAAMEVTNEPGAQKDASIPEPPPPPLTDEKEIVTSAEELQAWYVIKAVLGEVVTPKRITLKDNLSYCSVLLDGNTWKWICRLYFNSTQRVVAISKEDKTENRIPIKEIDDLYDLKTELTASLARYLKD